MSQLKLQLNIEPKKPFKTIKGLNKILQAPVCKNWNKTKK